MIFVFGVKMKIIKRLNKWFMYIKLCNQKRLDDDDYNEDNWKINRVVDWSFDKLN